MRLVGDELLVPIVVEVPRFSMRLLASPPANPHAPTLAELQAGVDLTPFLTTKETR